MSIAVSCQITPSVPRSRPTKGSRSRPADRAARHRWRQITFQTPFGDTTIAPTERPTRMTDRRARREIEQLQAITEQHVILRHAALLHSLAGEGATMSRTADDPGNSRGRHDCRWLPISDRGGSDPSVRGDGRVSPHEQHRADRDRRHGGRDQGARRGHEDRARITLVSTRCPSWRAYGRAGAGRPSPPALRKRPRCPRPASWRASG